jgi:hypothetical protein
MRAVEEYGPGPSGHRIALNQLRGAVMSVLPDLAWG